MCECVCECVWILCISKRPEREQTRRWSWLLVRVVTYLHTALLAAGPGIQGTLRHGPPDFYPAGVTLEYNVAPEVIGCANGDMEF